MDYKGLRGLGILGLVGIGVVHLKLWLGYYHLIPTIGPLFLFTFIFAWVLALVMIVFPRALVAVVAALFALATLGGYILALVLPMGIFLFTEQYISYSGGFAIASEFVGAIALLAWAGTRLLGGRSATGRATGSTASAARPSRQAASRPWTPDADPRSSGPARSGQPGAGQQIKRGLSKAFFGHT